MPTYEYHCKRCEVAFVLVMTIDEMRRYQKRLPRKCSACGARAVHRLFVVPAIHGDELRGYGTLLQQCEGDDREAERIVRAARKQGADVGYNSIYAPHLAESLGDRRAFFKQQDGKSAMDRRLKELHGKPLPKPIPLGEDLIQRHAQRMIAQNPRKAKDLRLLREEIIDRHGYKRRNRKRPDLATLLKV